MPAVPPPGEGEVTVFLLEADHRVGLRVGAAVAAAFGVPPAPGTTPGALVSWWGPTYTSPPFVRTSGDEVVYVGEGADRPAPDAIAGDRPDFDRDVAAARARELVASLGLDDGPLDVVVGPASSGFDRWRVQLFASPSQLRLDVDGYRHDLLMTGDYTVLSLRLDTRARRPVGNAAWGPAPDPSATRVLGLVRADGYRWLQVPMWKEPGKYGLTQSAVGGDALARLRRRAAEMPVLAPERSVGSFAVG